MYLLLFEAAALARLQIIIIISPEFHTCITPPNTTIDHHSPPLHPNPPCVKCMWQWVLMPNSTQQATSDDDDDDGRHLRYYLQVTKQQQSSEYRSSRRALCRKWKKLAFPQPFNHHPPSHHVASPSMTMWSEGRRQTVPLHNPNSRAKAYYQSMIIKNGLWVCGLVWWSGIWPGLHHSLPRSKSVRHQPLQALA